MCVEGAPVPLRVVLSLSLSSRFGTSGPRLSFLGPPFVRTCFCGSGLGGVALSPRLGDLQDVRCLSLSPPFLSTWFCGSGLGRLARGAWDLTWALLLQAIRAFRVRVSWFACFSRRPLQRGVAFALLFVSDQNSGSFNYLLLCCQR